MKENDNKNNNFIIVLFLIIVVLVLFFPKIYGFIQNLSLPKVEKTSEEKKSEEKTIDNDLLESLHYPIMRSNSYSKDTYYSLDSFKISDMSNSDILLTAFADIYEGNIIGEPKHFNADYMELRIKNILGRNVKYQLEDFNVLDDTYTDYVGTWSYDSSSNTFVYNQSYNQTESTTQYYTLEQFIKAEYVKDDLIVYKHIGFAKVDGSEYTIYKDANMTQELQKGTYTDIDDLNSLFQQLSNSDKNVYKYTFKDTLCTYNEYCLYEGKWVNEF